MEDDDSTEHLKKNEFLQAELSKLIRPDGTLHPEEIIEAATPDDHPLHKCFEWDDTEAARAYRLSQARQLIRYVRIVMPTKEQRFVAVRMFESLPSDRLLGNGYRTLQSILSDEEKMRELLASALRELHSFEERYKHLSELAGVIAEIRELRAASRKQRKRKAARKRPRVRTSLPRGKKPPRGAPRPSLS